ncbi:hypothetical protein EDF78_10780 [Rahnella sp. BIGb0236]|nr:hypothetical protein EDF78_10780 [Rahnella sp. BIGb0236]
MLCGIAMTVNKKPSIVYTSLSAFFSAHFDLPLINPDRLIHH